MAKVELPAISEETKNMLNEHVKKGKPRKFFLIYRGANIKTLVVFKKGPFGPKIMKAKKDGFKGEVAYGVVTGSGLNLFFQLPGSGAAAAAMKVDSWEAKPPTKRAKLREFLVDNDLRFKPSYHVITDPSQAPDPDAESDGPAAPPPPGSEVAEEDATQEASESQPETQPESQAESQPESTPPPAPDPDAMRFTSRLKALKPDLDRVLAAQLALSQDAKLRASQAATFARQLDFGAANAQLDELETLIQSGLTELSRSETGDTSELAESFKTRFSELLPRIKAVAGTPKGDEAKLRASEAGALARRKEFQQALAVLDQVAKLMVEEGVTSDAASPSDAKSQAAKLSEALKKMKPSLDRAIKADPSRQAEWVAATAQIVKQIRAGELDKARDGLLALRDQLTQPATPQPSETSESDAPTAAKLSLVRLGRARLQWQSTRAHAVQEMSRLKSAIVAQFQELPEMQASLDAGLAKLDAVVRTLDESLDELLDAVLNEANARRRQDLASDVRSATQQIIDRVNGDPVMAELDGNEVLPDIQITGPVLASLSEVAAALN